MESKFRVRSEYRPFWTGRICVLGWVPAIFLAFGVCAPHPALGQAVGDQSDAGIDADDARTDALLGMLYPGTSAPVDNLYATAPYAEQQVAPQVRLNAMLPINYDSNPLELGSGSPGSWGTFPVANLSAVTPLGYSMPFRISISARSQFKRFFNESNADIDRVSLSGRIQYVDPSNDQAWSPYFAIAPRWSFLPTYAYETEARQDFNLGIQKSWHLDSSFQRIPVAPDTSAETVWSFGVTAFAQNRQRQPQLSSDAVFLIPSVSCVVSKDLYANFAVELLGRWYQHNQFGEADHDWEALPIATLEYAIPAELLGGDNMARLLGHPAVSLQGSHLNVWSSVPGVSFNQWEASATIMAGWRF